MQLPKTNPDRLAPCHLSFGRVSKRHRSAACSSRDGLRLGCRALPQKLVDVVHAEGDESRVDQNVAGVTASLVRSSPYTTHGWRPTSAVNQPVTMAMKPLGKARDVPRETSASSLAGRGTSGNIRTTRWRA